MSYNSNPYNGGQYPPYNTYTRPNYSPNNGSQSNNTVHQYQPPRMPPPSTRPQTDGNSNQIPMENVGHISLSSANSHAYAPPSGPPPNTGANSYGNPNYSGPQLPNTQTQSYNLAGGGNFQYQYSTCQGKRKALLIGINYLNTQNELQGCINGTECERSSKHILTCLRCHVYVPAANTALRLQARRYGYG